MRVLFEMEGWQLVEMIDMSGTNFVRIKHNGLCGSVDTQYFKRIYDDVIRKHRCVKCWKVVPDGIKAVEILYKWKDI